MAASSAAIENAGKWSGSLPGCTTSAASSLDGNITSRTSSALSTLPAFTCCSDIYETGSSLSCFVALQGAIQLNIVAVGGVDEVNAYQEQNDVSLFKAGGYLLFPFFARLDLSVMPRFDEALRSEE